MWIYREAKKIKTLVKLLQKHIEKEKKKPYDCYKMGNKENIENGNKKKLKKKKEKKGKEREREET